MRMFFSASFLVQRERQRQNECFRGPVDAVENFGGESKRRGDVDDRTLLPRRERRSGGVYQAHGDRWGASKNPLDLEKVFPGTEIGSQRRHAAPNPLLISPATRVSASWLRATSARSYPLRASLAA